MDTLPIFPRHEARPLPAKFAWPNLRRRARLASFLALVALPTALAGLYEYGFAADQYVTTTKFVVREQMPQSAAPASVSSALSGFNPMLALVEDSQVVVQYIESPQALADLPPSLSLNQFFAAPRGDFWARMGSHLPPERQLLYWRRMVRPSLDLSSGIITVTVRAFSPQDSARLAAQILQGAQSLVDRMSRAARANALSYATQTANAARATLLADQAALAAYRNRYAVLFPELTAQQQSGIGGSVLLTLAQDEAQLAALRAQGQTDQSPQVQILTSRINAEQREADDLSARLAAAPGGPQSLASVMSGYDALTTTETLDQQLYAADLQALQNARNQADERSLYLESFVQPLVPRSSIYPVRWLVMLETAVAGFILWVLA
ncbi:hypothetical protein, partial [Acidocella sp.]|uniref:hypothetical protein n=1 Tax=Acidocella sp. TaxID=50710 RepID=UPI0026138CD7